MFKAIEHLLEFTIFRSRWLLAPMYLGLVGGLVILLVKFCQEFMHIASHVLEAQEQEVVLSLLALVDITLVANLLIMVIFSGYENFVSKIDVAENEDRPEWMGKVDYSGLKLKLIGSIVAISAIDLLKAFVHQSSSDSEHLSNTQMGWMVGIHITFIVTGLLFAIMDHIAEKNKHH
ncbi:TIGR00645 family protein [Methylobacillus gramineus]|uniref:TIGR00645 family protein n=1 Tax=Methylobacillus gramineus TaxID=755169 RepID=UPI001CFF6AE8|nr:TIGR00645 family protein [Methylobacillus gramineus]MCB5185914.1 TIGR00645 family protein [Methylobacillus gramineus]